jgi:hypothetical protein
MKWLGQNKIEGWIIAFLVVVVILILLAAVGFLSGRWHEAEAQPQVNLYDGIALDATLLRLDRRALDEAYHAQLLKLWGVWLVDGAKDPGRFKAGLSNARRAYGLALDAITKREQELQK